MLGIYKIVYQRGITQKKLLIDHSVYALFQDSLNDKEVMKSEKLTQKLKKEFKKLYGDEFFTTDSPLGKAIESGLLVLPDHQGGTQKCKVTLI